MSQELRWGIISCGLISQDFCVALKTLNPDEHKIVACAARDLHKAKEFAQRFNIENCYDSYDKVYEDIRVNIVYIGVVNNLHKEACLKAIEHGKHVLCEKPMSLNAREQEEIFNAAKKHNVFFMEALWTRFFPVVDRIREEIAKQSIGEVKMFQMNFFVPINMNDRLKLKELGGGAALDIGIYPVQFACLVFDHEEPTEIIAAGHLMETGVDESFTVILKFKNGRMATLTASTNCETNSTAVIAGEKGVIQIPEFAWCPLKLILPNGELFTAKLPKSDATNFFHSAGLSYEAEAARKAIYEGKQEHDFVKWDHSRLVMKILDEIRRQVGCQLPADE